MEIYCCFGDFFTNTDIASHFSRAEADIMLLGQYFSADYLRQEKGEHQYQLWVRSEYAETVSGTFPQAHKTTEDSIVVFFRLETPVEEIRRKLDEAFPKAEFPEWENFLRGIASWTKEN